jgi:hypothetical protein
MNVLASIDRMIRAEGSMLPSFSRARKGYSGNIVDGKFGDAYNE